MNIAKNMLLRNVLVLTLAASAVCRAHALISDPLQLPAEEPQKSASPTPDAPAPSSIPLTAESASVPPTAAAVAVEASPELKPKKAKVKAQPITGSTNVVEKAQPVEEVLSEQQPAPELGQVTKPLLTRSPSNTTFLELDRLRSSNAILTEKVKNQELMNKLKKDSLAPAAAAPTSPVSSSSPVFSFIGVYGMDDKITAEISSSRGIQTVRVGSTIPGLGKVQSISRDSIVLKKSSGAIVVLDRAGSVQ